MFDLDLFGDPVINGHKSILAQTFDCPPFSVLNARGGWWQERKRQWLALGIKSEVGRGGGNTNASSRAMELAGGFRPEHGLDRGGGADMGQCAAGDRKGPELLSQKANPGGSARPAMDYQNRQRGDGRGRAI